MGEVRKTEIVLGEHLMFCPVARHLKANPEGASELSGIGGLRYSTISVAVFAVRGCEARSGLRIAVIATPADVRRPQLM